MALTSIPETAYGRMLARGRLHDYEDSLVTHRLQTARKVLEALGITPTITHGTRTYYDWSMRGSLNADRHLCALDGSGYGDCTIEWPEWVTGAMFDEAYRLATRANQTSGAYYRTPAA